MVSETIFIVQEGQVHRVVIKGMQSRGIAVEDTPTAVVTSVVAPSELVNWITFSL